MGKIEISDFDHDGIKIERFEALLDEDGTPILLPTFFSMFTSKRLQVYKAVDEKSETSQKIVTRLVLSEISEVTFSQYMSHLNRYLDYCEKFAKEHTNAPNIHMHESAPDEFINGYINEELIGAQGKGQQSAAQAVGALSAYYNYLAHIGIAKVKDLRIYKNYRDTAAKNTFRKRAVKYLTLKTRSTLVNVCNSLRDELLLRMGWEVGLRSKENCGLLLNDFTYGKNTHKGLKSLFLEMQGDEAKEMFDYFLAGHYVKRTGSGGPGRSRKIYFNRDLLPRLYEYYVIERPESESDVFFLKTDSKGLGLPINTNTASEVFLARKKELLEKLQQEDFDFSIHEHNSYHHCRHTFGTNMFYELLGDQDVDSITAGSAAIITVAKLMGHKMDDPRSRNHVTHMYIRAVIEMKALEGM